MCVAVSRVLAQCACVGTQRAVALDRNCCFVYYCVIQVARCYFRSSARPSSLLWCRRFCAARPSTVSVLHDVPQLSIVVSSGGVPPPPPPPPRVLKAKRDAAIGTDGYPDACDAVDNCLYETVDTLAAWRRFAEEQAKDIHVATPLTHELCGHWLCTKVSAAEIERVFSLCGHTSWGRGATSWGTPRLARGSGCVTSCARWRLTRGTMGLGVRACATPTRTWGQR